jgi:CcmD family protein
MNGAKFGDVFSTTGKVLISLFLIFLGISVVYVIASLTLATAANNSGYLFAAYAVTWVIHIVYIGTIVSRYSRLKREMTKPGARS